MPGQTANFAIRYPCPGDTVTMDAFANWASDIENALLTVSELTEQASNRPRAIGRTSNAGTAVAAGAGPITLQATTIVTSVGLSNLSGVFTPTTTDSNGLYMLMAQVTPVNTATTVTSFKATILANNTVAASRTLASSVVGTIAKPISLVGLGFVTTVGGGALVQFEWTGTGGPLNVYAQLSLAYVAPAVP